MKRLIICLTILIGASCSKEDIITTDIYPLEIKIATDKTPSKVNILFNDGMLYSIPEIKDGKVTTTTEKQTGRYGIQDIVFIYEDQSFERILKQGIIITVEPKENSITLDNAYLKL